MATGDLPGAVPGGSVPAPWLSTGPTCGPCRHPSSGTNPRNTLKENRILIESWRCHDHAVRPHSSLGSRSSAPKTIMPSGTVGSATLRRPSRLAEKPPMHEHSHWTSRRGRAAPSVPAEKREPAVFDPVPLADPGRQVADVDVDPKFADELPEFHLPELHLIPVESPAVGRGPQPPGPGNRSCPMRRHQRRRLSTANAAVSWLMPTLTLARCAQQPTRVQPDSHHDSGGASCQILFSCPQPTMFRAPAPQKPVHRRAPGSATAHAT